MPTPPADEVELRLSPGPDGGTLLEIEHGHGQPAHRVGRSNCWMSSAGIGSGWELPLTFSLPKYLRGELPDAPAARVASAGTARRPS